ncbi:hypothetical protein AZH53_10750 [Methanomicrobiaceae archaeon CYW5]|nr:hypothetical protein [Methanovulcanius yangii]
MGEKVRDQLRGAAGDKEPAGTEGESDSGGGAATSPPPAETAAGGAAKPAVTPDDIIGGPAEVGRSAPSADAQPAAEPSAASGEVMADVSAGMDASWDVGEKGVVAEDLTRRLEDASADEEIRRRLDSVREWEEKEEAAKQEKDLQRKEIEREYEQRRKDERHGKWKRNAMVVGGLLVIVLVAALLSFSVSMNLPSTAESFPFISTYDVRMPQGTPVEFANIPVTVSGTGEKVIVSIAGGLGTELQVGDQITFSDPRRVNIRIFGITLLETDYQVIAEFRGYIPQTQQNDFYVAVMTTDPLPGWAVDVILPDNVEAYPVNAEIV